MNIKNKINKKYLIICSCLFIIFISIRLFIHYANKVINVNIIFFNDFHGAVENQKLGASKFIQAIKEWSNKNTIVVSGGDNFYGEAISNLLYGEPVAKMFKEIKLTASAVGNHDLTWGIEKMYELEETMDAPFISANIYTNNNYRLFKPYIIKKINGVKVAFIGLTTQNTKIQGNINIVKNLVFADPVLSIKNTIAQVKKEGADIVILLTHIATYMKDDKIYFENDDLDKLTQIKDVNLILTAHYHNLIYGLTNNKIILQNEANGKTIMKITIPYNKYRKLIVSPNIEIRDLYDEVVDNNLINDNNTDIVLDKYKNELSTILNKQLGKIDYDLTHSRDKQSVFGNFINKILLKKSKAQISIINSGLIRNDIKKGNITYKDLYSSIPFNNNIVKIKLDGKSIKNIFKHFQNNKIAHIQYSGIKLKNNKLFLNNNKAIKDNELYTIITNDFLLNGGDGFDFSNAIQLELYDSLQNIIIENLTTS